MHVVEGRDCAKCATPIHSAKRALACEACALQFHKKCLADKRSCAQCGVDLIAAADAGARLREEEARRTIANGRFLLWVVTVVGVGVPAVLELAIVALGEGAERMNAAIRLALQFLLVLAVHRGSAKIARGFAILWGFGSPIWIVLGIGLCEHSLVLGALTIGIGVAYGLVAATMALSDDVWRYLNHRREEHEGPISG